MHAAKKAAEVFTQTESGFPQLHEFLECDQFMLKLYDVGAAVQGRELNAYLEVFLPKLYS